MNDETKPTDAAPVAQAKPSPRARLRREADALRLLARRVPHSRDLTPAQIDTLHRAIDAYVFVWRDVRLAAGLSIEGVFPPAADPAEAMVPRDRRKVPV